MREHAHPTLRRAVASAVAVTTTALLLGLVGVGTAHACSCATPDLASVLAGDAGQALVLAQRTDLDGGPEGSLRVLATLAGGPVLGPVEARFDNGGSCDPGVVGGGVAALVLAGDDRTWTTTTCGVVPLPEALEAAGGPLALDDDAGPPTLLLAGGFGGARLAAVDASGRTTAWGEGAGVTRAIAACPGDAVVVDVAHEDGGLVLQRWSLPDLAPMGEALPLPGEAFGLAVRCLDADGRRVQVAVPAYEGAGAVLAVDGDAVSEQPAPVRDAAAAGGTLAVLVADDGTGSASGVAVVDDDGGLVRVLTRPDTVLDQLAVSPDGEHVLAAGYPDAGGNVVVVAPTDGSGAAERHLDAFASFGWLTAERVWMRAEAGGQPFGASTSTVAVLDRSLADAGSVDAGPGWDLRELPDGAVLQVGVGPPSVRRDGVTTTAADVRLAAAEHAVPLDPTSVLTASTEPTAEETPTLTEPVGAQLADGVDARLVAAFAGLVAVGALVLARRRGR